MFLAGLFRGFHGGFFRRLNALYVLEHLHGGGIFLLERGDRLCEGHAVGQLIDAGEYTRILIGIGAAVQRCSLRGLMRTVEIKAVIPDLGKLYGVFGFQTEIAVQRLFVSVDHGAEILSAAHAVDSADRASGVEILLNLLGRRCLLADHLLFKLRKALRRHGKVEEIHTPDIVQNAGVQRQQRPLEIPHPFRQQEGHAAAGKSLALCRILRRSKSAEGAKQQDGKQQTDPFFHMRFLLSVFRFCCFCSAMLIRFFIFYHIRL